MRNGFSLGLAALIAVFAFTNASATVLSVTYTADNVVGAWYQNGGAPVAQAVGGNAANWRVADTANLNLGWGSYQLIFRVNNVGGPGSGNPAGFLAEVSGTHVNGDLLSSTQWEWAVDAGGTAPLDFGTLSWAAATEYGNNGGANIWTSANGGAPISGISTSAQWIWSDDNVATGSGDPMDTSIWVRGQYNIVPEPTTVSFLGLGLLGIGWMKRRRKS